VTFAIVDPVEDAVAWSTMVPGERNDAPPAGDVNETTGGFPAIIADDAIRKPTRARNAGRNTAGEICNDSVRQSSIYLFKNMLCHYVYAKKLVMLD
jgi:hypothetical protein